MHIEVDVRSRGRSRTCPGRQTRSLPPPSGREWRPPSARQRQRYERYHGLSVRMQRAVSISARARTASCADDGQRRKQPCWNCPAVEPNFSISMRAYATHPQGGAHHRRPRGGMDSHRRRTDVAEAVQYRTLDRRYWG